MTKITMDISKEVNQALCSKTLSPNSEFINRCFQLMLITSQSTITLDTPETSPDKTLQVLNSLDLPLKKLTVMLMPMSTVLSSIMGRITTTNLIKATITEDTENDLCHCLFSQYLLSILVFLGRFQQNTRYFKSGNQKVSVSLFLCQQYIFMPFFKDQILKPSKMIKYFIFLFSDFSIDVHAFEFIQYCFCQFKRKLSKQKLFYSIKEQEIRKMQSFQISIDKLFTDYDKNGDGVLTRNEIGLLLSDIYRYFNIHKIVNPIDIDNFLQDYDIHHKNDLTKQDFSGFNKIRFQVKPNSMPVRTYVQPPSVGFMKPIIHKTVEVHQNSLNNVGKLKIPVSMLFDVFNKNHTGVLTRFQLVNVMNLIFSEFGVPYKAVEEDVINFLQDFDINHDDQITYQDFKGKDMLTFRLHH